MHLFLINSICCKKKTKVNDLPLGQDYDWVKQFEKRGDLTYGARPYLMTLCFIFPIHVNFPIRPRGVLKTTIHRKKLDCTRQNYTRKILFIVVLISLEQHCTGQNPMQCCLRGYRQHSTGRNPALCRLKTIWSHFRNFYFGPVNFLISGCCRCHANIVQI